MTSPSRRDAAEAVLLGLEARDLPPLLADCSRCDDARLSDRLTIDEALTSGWAVIDNELICPVHLTVCSLCGGPCILESDGCVDNVSWHCRECYLSCRSCGLWDMAEARGGLDD